jgi:hypothetical protein
MRQGARNNIDGLRYGMPIKALPRQAASLEPSESSSRRKNMFVEPDQTQKLYDMPFKPSPLEQAKSCSESNMALHSGDFET